MGYNATITCATCGYYNLKVGICTGCGKPEKECTCKLPLIIMEIETNVHRASLLLKQAQDALRTIREEAEKDKL